MIIKIPLAVLFMLMCSATLISKVIEPKPQLTVNLMYKDQRTISPTVLKLERKKKEYKKNLEVSNNHYQFFNIAPGKYEICLTFLKWQPRSKSWEECTTCHGDEIWYEIELDWDYGKSGTKKIKKDNRIQIDGDKQVVVDMIIFDADLNPAKWSDKDFRGVDMVTEKHIYQKKEKCHYYEISVKRRYGYRCDENSEISEKRLLPVPVD